MDALLADPAASARAMTACGSTTNGISMLRVGSSPDPGSAPAPGLSVYDVLVIAVFTNDAKQALGQAKVVDVFHVVVSSDRRPVVRTRAGTFGATRE